jgi:hypothetical protein
MLHRPLALALAALALAACGPDTARNPLEPAAPSLARRGTELPFRGTIDAVEEGQPLPGTGLFLVRLKGEGTASHLGRYTLVAEYTITPATLAGPGTLTFTAANGDVLTATVVVETTVTGGGTGATTVETATITGGTGRFARATGSFTLRRAVLFTADTPSSGSFDGTISLNK